MVVWRDPQYGSVVAAEYLSDLEKFIDVHTLLAQYFLGKWSGDVAKPYTLTEELVKLFKLPPNGEAVSHVAAQPLVFPVLHNQASYFMVFVATSEDLWNCHTISVPPACLKI